MPSQNLPERPSLEYLRKLAKERLRVLRQSDQAAKLADAQLAVAREHGFPSWRALKAEVDRRRAPNVTEFFRACAAGDVETLRRLLTGDRDLVRERNDHGSTGLHQAFRHSDAVRLLIEHGADPNARDHEDNATPLHFAAANGCLESVRLLLDAGADPQGAGDVHHGDVIGWATHEGNEAVIDLLLERGARHHIFSAIAVGDVDLVERLVDEQPECLLRRRSRFENGNTPLHDAIAPPDPGRRPNYAMLQRLIELGADVEATDDKGRTPLEVAMLRGDHEAMRVLKAAGARGPKSTAEPVSPDALAVAARSIRKAVPMYLVRDMRATVQWYESVGFTVRDRYEENGELMFARVCFGDGEFTLSPGEDPDPRGTRLWFLTDRVQDLYSLFKQRQLRAAQIGLMGASADEPDVPFEEDLYAPFYGGFQFSIRDNNGLTLIFWQPEGLAPRQLEAEE
jgi:ankyrin repeat protein